MCVGGGSGAPVLLLMLSACTWELFKLKKIVEWCSVGVYFLPFSSRFEVLGRNPRIIACFVMKLSSGTC